MGPGLTQNFFVGKSVKTVKCLGSLFDANGGAEKDVNNRMKIACSKWREITGVVSDIIIMAGMAGYLIEERRRWLIINASLRGQCSK